MVIDKVLQISPVMPEAPSPSSPQMYEYGMLGSSTLPLRRSRLLHLTSEPDKGYTSTTCASIQQILVS